MLGSCIAHQRIHIRVYTSGYTVYLGYSGYNQKMVYQYERREQPKHILKYEEQTEVLEQIFTVHFLNQLP